MSEQSVETVVVGGGQAGLSVGYHLARRRIPFVILDENEEVGDAWRRRWDSLQLFTPARLSGLPGLRFPGSGASYPGKDEIADYMKTYAREFDLPVHTGVGVSGLSKRGSRFRVVTRDDSWLADNVVLATGAYHTPRIPEFASELDESITQLHSKEYRNPLQLREGGALVVGAGNSGAEIAVEIAKRHQTWLSGRDPGQEPTRAGSIPDRLITPMLWFMATKVLTVETRVGRKVRDHFLDPPRGIPLGRVRRREVVAAGVERVARTTGVRGGWPLLEDGRVLEVSNVIWCTGFRPDFDWIDIPLPGHNGVPDHRRGVVESCPGLYLIGLPFLYSLSSALVGGVGRDAEHIVAHIASTRALRNRESQTASPAH